MSEGYSIEVADELVGVVVREKGERYFTFFTAVKAFNALDGHKFRGPLDAEHAARAHAAQRRQKRKRPDHRVVERAGAPRSSECVWSAQAGAAN